MKKHLSMLLLACAVGAMVSCSQNLSPEPPTSVTNPSVINTYQKALDGDIKSLKTIGKYYNSGLHGFPQSTRKAINAYQMAANLGDVESQCITGAAYLDGNGRMQSDSSARKYLGMAADSGSSRANNLLLELEKRIQQRKMEQARKEAERKARKAQQERMQMQMIQSMFAPTYVVY